AVAQCDVGRPANCRIGQALSPSPNRSVSCRRSANSTARTGSEQWPLHSASVASPRCSTAHLSATSSACRERGLDTSSETHAGVCMISTPLTAHDVLVVDDDPAITEYLEHLLTRDGHRTRTAQDGRKALAEIASHSPDLIVLDLDLPELDGFEVCKRLRNNRSTRLIPILMITGKASPDDKLRAWELGADDFVSKPIQSIEMQARCRSLLRQKSMIDDLDGAECVVFALARIIEAKSPYTRGHSERVREQVCRLASRLGLSEEERETLARGAILHDIGKVSIPDAILNKRGRLTPEEYQRVKDHCDAGARIIEPLHSVRDTVPIIRWHHERMDGRGYPDGLVGEAIPLLTRMITVADVYDAMSSDRPYRRA